MSLIARLAADVVLALHAGYVLFVICGLLLTIMGGILRWSWIRNFWFRGLHLLAIAIVVAEAWLGITCPLTTLENWLRSQAGLARYQGDFVASWMHDMLFYDLPHQFFTVAYTLFGLAVLLSCLLIPPRWPRRNDGMPSSL